MKIQGKTALVTGAGLRIGREIALMLAGRGARLLLHYHRSVREVRAVQKQIEQMGEEAVTVRADFSGRGRAGALKRFIKTVLSEEPGVDILINNAACFFPAPPGKIREQDWDLFMNVNLKAPFFLAEALGRRMAARKQGKIINLADWTFQVPPRDYLPYAVSKAGLHTATIGLARVLAPHVQVNSIAPGPILSSRGMTAAKRRAVTEKTLLKRFGSPEDIAATVRYLIEGTDYVTGALIPVDGGSSIA